MREATLEIEARHRLRQGVESFNAWRREHADEALSLARLIPTPESADEAIPRDERGGWLLLTGLDLRGVDLTFARFERVAPWAALLQDADLRGVRMEHVDPRAPASATPLLPAATWSVAIAAAWSASRPCSPKRVSSVAISATRASSRRI